MSGEELLRHYMAQGWNISIECKGKGRTYEMTYEATATLVGKSMLDDDFVIRHAVGDSLDELLHNLFAEEAD